MGFGDIFKGVLKAIPGVGTVVSVLDGVGSIADAIGGEAGGKIKSGLSQVSDGLRQADADDSIPPEHRAQIAQATLAAQTRIRELELEDIQGGRELAMGEIASEDEYVRRTRPGLLRLYGKATILLILGSVATAFVAAFSTAINTAEAAFIIDVLKWALPSLSGTFLLMFRVYTGKRTDEKLADRGIQPEGLVDKLLKFRRY